MALLYRKMGRDADLKGIQQYLDQGEEGSGGSDDDDEYDNESVFWA